MLQQTNKQSSGTPNYQLIGPAATSETVDQLRSLAREDARLRLQSLLTQWLHLENLVVLAGAGTSTTVGGKLMLNLEESVLTAVASVPELAPDAKKLVQNRKQSLKKSQQSGLSFEEWLSYLSNAHMLSLKKNSPIIGVHWRSNLSIDQKTLQNLIKWIKNAILMECYLAIPEPYSTSSDTVDPNHSHMAFLCKLVARDTSLGRLHLFTLNYDTLFEQALDWSGIQYFDGFSGHVNPRFDPGVYGLDMYYPTEIIDGKVHRFDKLVHLYKLHGSIHWHETRGKLHARHRSLNQIIKRYRNQTNIREKAKMLKSHANKMPAYIILPTANKFADTLLMPYAHMFRAFYDRLSVPQTFLMVIGYSFSDSHVNQMIETALTNPSLVMLVVEPNPQSETIERIRRYSSSGARAFVLTSSEDSFEKEGYRYSTFDDFAQSVLPNVQWLDDLLRVRRFEREVRPSGLDD